MPSCRVPGTECSERASKDRSWWQARVAGIRECAGAAERGVERSARGRGDARGLGNAARTVLAHLADEAHRVVQVVGLDPRHAVTGAAQRLDRLRRRALRVRGREHGQKHSHGFLPRTRDSSRAVAPSSLSNRIASASSTPAGQPGVREETMSQRRKAEDDDDLLSEYDFSGAVRGKYYERAVAGTNVVLLEPDVAKVFRDSAIVSQALREYLQEHGGPPTSAKRAG